VFRQAILDPGRGEEGDHRACGRARRANLGSNLARREVDVIIIIGLSGAARNGVPDGPARGASGLFVGAASGLSGARRPGC